MLLNGNVDDYQNVGKVHLCFIEDCDRRLVVVVVCWNCNHRDDKILTVLKLDAGDGSSLKRNAFKTASLFLQILVTN